MAISEYYQRLAPLLIEPINRTHRLYLESNLDLLEDEYERFLTLFIGEYDDHPIEQQRLRIRRELLRDIRMRGSTIPSIRKVYVNKFGGLMLDLSPELIEIEQQLAVITHGGWTDRMVAICKVRLQDAIEAMQTEHDIVPETLAELQYRLGTLFLQASSYVSQTLLTRVLTYYEDSLQTYTIARYPLQHAKVLLAIGDAHMHCSLDKRQENLDYALSCYNAASRIYNEYKALP